MTICYIRCTLIDKLSAAFCRLLGVVPVVALTVLLGGLERRAKHVRNSPQVAFCTRAAYYRTVEHAEKYPPSPILARRNSGVEVEH